MTGTAGFDDFAAAFQSLALRPGLWTELSTVGPGKMIIVSSADDFIIGFPARGAPALPRRDTRPIGRFIVAASRAQSMDSNASAAGTPPAARLGKPAFDSLGFAFIYHETGSRGSSFGESPRTT